MDEPLLSMLTQFGPAGLIGMLWLYERRTSAARERQLTEAHTRIIQQREELNALLEVVKENTRVVASLKQSQEHLIKLLRSVLPGAGSAA